MIDDSAFMRKVISDILTSDYRIEGTENMIRLSDETLVQGHRPSVDVLFYSIAELEGMNKIAVVLTGMGQDVTNGVKRLRETDQHAIILVESEETAIVYGMPKRRLKPVVLMISCQCIK